MAGHIFNVMYNIFFNTHSINTHNINTTHIVAIFMM